MSNTGTSHHPFDSDNYRINGVKIINNERKLINIEGIKNNGDLTVGGNIVASGSITSLQSTPTQPQIVGIAQVGYSRNGTMSAWEEDSPTGYSGTSLFIGPFQEPVGGSISVTDPVKAMIILKTTVYNATSGTIMFKFTGDTGTDNNTSIGDIQYGLTQRSWKTDNAGPFTLLPVFVAGPSGWNGSVTIEGTVYLYK